MSRSCRFDRRRKPRANPRDTTEEAVPSVTTTATTTRYAITPLLRRAPCVGDARSTSVKRVASAVGEGSICIQLVHRALAELLAATPSRERVGLAPRGGGD